MKSTCPHCSAPLETPLACGACGVVLGPAQPVELFGLFGLEPQFALDTADLRKRLVRFTRLVHPDFFGSDAQQRELAERSTAELNTAFEILSNDHRRADYLVRSLGGPDEKDERQMPQAFLMEVMEWNETLEGARGAAPNSPERASAAALDAELASHRGELLASIGQQLAAPLPSADGASAPELTQRLTETRRLLNAVRYIDRALGELAEMRLAQASSN